jgi:hypothetical protein
LGAIRFDQFDGDGDDDDDNDNEGGGSPWTVLAAEDLQFISGT